MVEMTPVVGSSNVQAIGYDADALQLSIVFKGGQQYDYREVPPDLYRALEKAESKGAFIAANIVGKYPSAKVTKS